jgi:transporter family-2 protein
MTGGAWIAVLLIVLGGAAVAVQAPVNGALGRSLQSPLVAATVSFGVGFAALLALSLLGSGGAMARLGGVPFWQFAGGLLGAFYVWAMVSTISILGQLGAALLIDHVGAFGVAVQPVSPRRLIAVALVAAGLVLSRL